MRIADFRAIAVKSADPDDAIARPEAQAGISVMEPSRFYVCRVRLGGDEIFVVWYQNDRDGFVSAAGGGLMWARSAEGIATAAQERGIPLVLETFAQYEFDQIRKWCEHPSAEGIECHAFLNAWNFFDDLAAIHEPPETDYARLSRGASGSYDKLFWGCNLPTVTPQGERFDPTWSQEDINNIRAVLEAGLALLLEQLQAP